MCIRDRARLTCFNACFIHLCKAKHDFTIIASVCVLLFSEGALHPLLLDPCLPESHVKFFLLIAQILIILLLFGWFTFQVFGRDTTYFLWQTSVQILLDYCIVAIIGADFVNQMLVCRLVKQVLTTLGIL